MQKEEKTNNILFKVKINTKQIEKWHHKHFQCSDQQVDEKPEEKDPYGHLHMTGIYL